MRSCEKIFVKRRIIFDDFWSKCSTKADTPVKSGFNGKNDPYRKSNILKPVKYGSAQLDYHVNERNIALCYLTPTSEINTSAKSIVKCSHHFDAHPGGTVQNEKSPNHSLDVRTVRFHPRVNVKPIDAVKNSKSTNKSDSNWYTAEELTSFRLEATSKVTQQKTKFHSSKYVSKPLFTDPAL